MIDKLDKVDLIELIEYADVLYKLKEEIYDMLDYINIILLKKAKKTIYTQIVSKLWKIPKRDCNKMQIMICV